MSDYCDNATRQTDNQIKAILKEISANVQNMNDRGELSEIRYCEDCGDLIPTARIKAVPNAIRCVRCQSAFENRER